MNTLLAALSIFVTFLLVITALFILFKDSKPKKKSEKDMATEDEEWNKKHDEVHDLWYYFGFVDDAPNVIREVVAGPEKSGRPKRFIANLRYGNINSKNGLIEMVADPNDLKDGEDLSPFLNWIRHTFGKRWYGIPFITNVKPLTIDRVVNKNTGATQKDEKKTEGYDVSVELEAMPVRRYGLYGEILRPTFHKDMDTEDNIRFSVISYAVLQVFDASIPFNVYPDNYLITISKLISGYVSELTFKVDYAEYKKRGNKLTDVELAELSERLKTLGVKVVSMTFGDPVLHPSIQADMEVEAKAKQNKLAKKQLGESERDYLIDTGEGEGQKIERLSKANASRINELTAVYTANGMKPEQAVIAATSLILGQANADAVSKLTGVYAPGTGSVVTLSK